LHSLGLVTQGVQSLGLLGFMMAEHMKTSGRTVLITGCSTGIGRSTALVLADRGFTVFGGVRSERHADELKAMNAAIAPVIMDVTREEDIARVVETLRNASAVGLWGLVNNAGVGLPAAVEFTSRDDLLQLFEVNTIAPLRLMQACLPLLRTARGRIVNVTSMNGILALPMVGGYSASKFALEALSDTLRIELRPWEVSVSVVRPGQIRTAIFDKAGAALTDRTAAITPELLSGYETMYARGEFFNQRGVKSPTPPEAVAKAVVHALTARSPRPHYHVGIDAQLMKTMRSWLPTRIRDRIIARVMGTFRRLA
jgi:NAD(P)-dependent dehydrogenase (short-subunit alcohol dehydrogenase family)